MKSSAALSSQQRNRTVLTSRAGQSSSLDATARRSQHDLGREHWGERPGLRPKRGTGGLECYQHWCHEEQRLRFHQPSLIPYLHFPMPPGWYNMETVWPSDVSAGFYGDQHINCLPSHVWKEPSFSETANAVWRENGPWRRLQSTEPHSTKPSTTWASRHWCGDVGKVQLAGTQSSKQKAYKDSYYEIWCGNF